MIKQEDIDILNKFDNFCGDALNENKCYYIENSINKHSKSFKRIEFYKPWFFYIQSFGEWTWWGNNTKYVFKCSDIINFISNDNVINELEFHMNNENLDNRFSYDENKIIQFITNLYEKKQKIFDLVFRYLSKNIDYKIINWINRDCF